MHACFEGDEDEHDKQWHFEFAHFHSWHVPKMKKMKTNSAKDREKPNLDQVLLVAS